MIPCLLLLVACCYIMIHGVKLKQLKIFPDDRGWLAELAKQDEEVFVPIKQTNVTLTYPGVIKAFHWHRRQTDLWFVASGMTQVVLFDIRANSPSFRQTDVYYLGEDNRALLLIPPGVVHGYKVLGTKPALLFYHTDQVYDPSHPDEERLAYNDRRIGFDWTTKFR